jgi:hypothetical protein
MNYEAPSTTPPPADSRSQQLVAKVRQSRADLEYLETRNADEQLRDHCSLLVNKVDMAREIKLQSIAKSNHNSMEQIDCFEKKSDDNEMLYQEISSMPCASSFNLPEAVEQVAESIAMIDKRISEIAAYQSRLLASDHLDNYELAWSPNRHLLCDDLTLGKLFWRPTQNPPSQAR